MIVTNIAVTVEYSKIKDLSFGELCGAVYEMVLELGRNIVEEVVEETGKEVHAARDDKKYEDKGYRTTTIKTKLGDVKCKRRVYRNRFAEGDEAKYVYLVDEAMKIEKVGKIEKGFCIEMAETVMEGTFRSAAKNVKDNSGTHLSAMGVWNAFQALGECREKEIARLSELEKKDKGPGEVATKILYTESDGVWLKLQGNSRKAYGPSKEMKMGIAYDGVLYAGGKGNEKSRRVLDTKVAYATMESSDVFRQGKDAVVAGTYRTDEVELWVMNGDGAQWISKTDKKNTISVLDEYHRNKAITRCVRDTEIAKQIFGLLHENNVPQLMGYLEAMTNSLEGPDRENMKELHRYFKENEDSLLGYYDRGITIPETRDPSIHHARLGSMESNVFTLIGNRMKDGRACWSVSGANHMALLLCLYHTTGLDDLALKLEPLDLTEETEEDLDDYIFDGNPPSGNVPYSVGKGYNGFRTAEIPIEEFWLKDIAKIQRL